jgi:hypothetical protein
MRKMGTESLALPRLLFFTIGSLGLASIQSASKKSSHYSFAEPVLVSVTANRKAENRHDNHNHNDYRPQ